MVERCITWIKAWIKDHLRDWLRESLELDEFHDVRTFHEKFDLLVHYQPVHLTKRKLMERIECLQEELDEFELACQSQDASLQADALIDLVYFAKGTAVMLGLPWQQLWDDVHRANMAKIRGISHRGHKVDCIKPHGWIAPKTNTILYRAGYRRHIYVTPFNTIDEEKCYDDKTD